MKIQTLNLTDRFNHSEVKEYIVIFMLRGLKETLGFIRSRVKTSQKILISSDFLG